MDYVTLKYFHLSISPKMNKVLKSLGILSIILMLSCNNEEISFTSTTIEVQNDTLFINRIPIGDSISINFEIKNTGNIDLKIKDVSPACSCSIAGFDTSGIVPGESTQISVIYKNNFDTGSIIKVFVLNANTDVGLTPLYLSIQ